MLDKVSPRGTGGTLPGAALIAKNGSGGGGGHVLWDHVASYMEVRDDVTGAPSQGGQRLPARGIVGRALFHGLLMLSSRPLAHRSSIRHNTDTAYVLFVDSEQGGVVRLKGDVSKLELNTEEVYASAAQWIKEHVEVTISPIEKVWNRFGNANWGDMGALQLLLAIFHSIEQCQGSPKNPLAEMAALHSERLQQRLMDRETLEMQENGDGSSQHSHSHRRSSRREIEEEEEVNCLHWSMPQGAFLE